MVQGLIVKWIFKAIMKAIQKKHDLKKIDAYVNKPNELDKQVKSLQKTVNKYGKYIEEIEKDISQIKVIAHKPVDWLEKIKELEKEIKAIKGIVSINGSIKDKLKKIRR